MRPLTLKLPPTLWAALEQRRAETGESVEHLVRAALADYLEVEHQTLFQVSTAGALVEGIYRGAVTVGHLKEHGNFGLGTFEDIDGELVLVDGHAYQVRADGGCDEVADATASPFAIVTHFQPTEHFVVADCADLAALTAQIDQRRASENVFYAMRVDGRFSLLHTRAMCRTAEGVPLVVAAAHQPEFDLRDVQATLVGFWTPAYAKNVGIPGYHLHAVTDDRRAGGHVLDCRGRDLRVQIQPLSELRVALPSTREFLHADLTRDPTADLDRAER
ncbi:MAG: acetolactate decarboxylase [Candidatus Binatia bacterium]